MTPQPLSDLELAEVRTYLTGRMGNPDTHRAARLLATVDALRAELDGLRGERTTHAWDRAAGASEGEAAIIAAIERWANEEHNLGPEERIGDGSSEAMRHIAQRLRRGDHLTAAASLGARGSATPPTDTRKDGGR